jgi:hypothetical protein
LSVFTTNPISSKNIIDMMNIVDLIVKFMITVKSKVTCVRINSFTSYFDSGNI